MRRIAALTGLFLAALPAFHNVRAATLTPELALKVRHISEITFSPDGAHPACTVSEPPKGDERITHVWLLDTRTSEFRQFTSSAKSEHAPRWSPDGRTLAFLSNRQDRSQVYTIRIDGGEARAITSGKTAVTAFRWSHDGKSIAFPATEPKSAENERKEKEKDDDRAWNAGRRLSMLYRSPMASSPALELPYTPSNR